VVKARIAGGACSGQLIDEVRNLFIRLRKDDGGKR
jgi:hypothetical protein